MPKLFCSDSSCAKATTYDAMKPKFCSHCGQPFDAAFKASAINTPPRQRLEEYPRPMDTGFKPSPQAHPQPKAPYTRQIPNYYQRPAARQQYNEYGEPIEDESYEVPMHFEIKASIVGQTKKMSFGDLANMPIDSHGGDRMRGSHTDVNKILADARQSMSKQAISDIDGE